MKAKDLLKNTEVFKNIISNITRYAANNPILLVTNCGHIDLCYCKISGFPENKVIGSGTVLDTARFRYLLAYHVGVDARNVHGYIIGEHGDTEVAAWSISNIAGIPIDAYCEKCKRCKDKIRREEIFTEVKNAAYKIIKRRKNILCRPVSQENSGSHRKE